MGRSMTYYFIGAMVLEACMEANLDSKTGCAKSYLVDDYLFTVYRRWMQEYPW